MLEVRTLSVGIPPNLSPHVTSRERIQNRAPVVVHIHHGLPRHGHDVKLTVRHIKGAISIVGCDVLGLACDDRFILIAIRFRLGRPPELIEFVKMSHRVKSSGLYGPEYVCGRGGPFRAAEIKRSDRRFSYLWPQIPVVARRRMALRAEQIYLGRGRHPFRLDDRRKIYCFIFFRNMKLSKR